MTDSISNFLFQLPHFNDNRGHLTVIENRVPFEVKRVYWIHGVEGLSRGGHRHKETIQALIALSGEVEIYMDNGYQKFTIKLSSSDKYLLIEPQYWHTMSFRKNAILLVLSSTFYDVNDYIDEPYE